MGCGAGGGDRLSVYGWFVTERGGRDFTSLSFSSGAPFCAPQLNTEFNQVSKGVRCSLLHPYRCRVIRVVGSREEETFPINREKKKHRPSPKLKRFTSHLLTSLKRKILKDLEVVVIA